MKNYQKTDPPKTIYEFSENKFKKIFVSKIGPQNPKNSPENYPKSKKMAKKGPK